MTEKDVPGWSEKNRKEEAGRKAGACGKRHAGQEETKIITEITFSHFNFNPCLTSVSAGGREDNEISNFCLLF